MRTLLAVLTIILVSCSNNSNQKENNMSQSSALTVSSKEFGNLPDGTPIEQYTVEATNGVSMKVITYGGIITSLMVPDKEGNLADVVLGYDNLDGYVKENPYFGAIIGRFGNRIAKGEFELDGETYKLATNNAPNHLHGGDVGFDKVVWKAKEVREGEAAGVELTYESADMEEGYPGTMQVKVTYLMAKDGTLDIDYEATTDKKTVVNLTNHSYFNLGADKSTILDHKLLIKADRFLPVDSTLIPTGELDPVKGTPFDFTAMKTVGEEVNADHEQLKFGQGYDHCWVLNDSDESLALAAALYEPQSGRFLEVYTTEPGIQFYSGNFLDGTLTGKGGTEYSRRSGLCLETQHFPDSPNQPQFPTVVLNPGDKYESTTRLAFSTKK